MTTTDTANVKPSGKLLQLPELRTESAAVEIQYHSLWRSL